MQEIFKTIEGYNGKYQISNFGNIKAITSSNPDGKLRALEKSKSKDAFYYRITLHDKEHTKRFLVHRLVAEYFIPKLDPSKDQINHIDNNGLNNHVDNLEWCTASENMQHSHKQDRQKHVKAAAAIGRKDAANKKAQLKYSKFLNVNLNGRILLSFYVGGNKKQEYKGNFACAKCHSNFIASLDATLRNQQRSKPLYCRSCSSKEEDIV